MALKTEPSQCEIATIAGRAVTFPLGFKASAVRAGLKSRNHDLVLIASDRTSGVAGVFTTNVVHAACVSYSKQIVINGLAQAIFCNSGNANACTGDQGEKDNLECARLTADSLGIPTEQVLVASTGVIGRQMPMDKVESAVPGAANGLASSPETDGTVARAILTTDTRPKSIAMEVSCPHWPKPIRIGGIAKGSGMIAPNMATTLGFITTDAKIDPKLLQQGLWSAIDRSFNRVTVDGDTSTNDMVLVLANGASGSEVAPNSGLAEFNEALEGVCVYLAKEVARDGEGATKLIEVVVKGAASEKEAARVAKTIAESPLVKTALFGCDPNWGRIMAAAGRAGVPFRPAEADAWIGDFQVFAKGCGAEFDSEAAHEYLQKKEISVTVSLGHGPGECAYWTCDYSYDYVKINAEYHT